MKRRIKILGAGVKAAARSLLASETRYQVKGAPLVCRLCGHDEFDQRPMLINTMGMTFINLDWLNDSACALVCRECHHIELFTQAPPFREDPAAEPGQTPAAHVPTLAQCLKHLDSLRAQNRLSLEEYQTRRSEIIAFFEGTPPGPT